ncbi:MAG: hypothetical protein LBP85_08200 [Prevotellaceae bacterium]|jgi:hypothetical protein|nr:hypothetical protein [Prevotellaceae bacterium]
MDNNEKSENTSLLTEDEKEYVKDLAMNIESDKKYNLLLITFNLATIVIVINGIIFSENQMILNVFEKITISFGLLSISVGTVCFFNWFMKLHLLRIETTDLFITKKIENARKQHYPGEEFFKKHSFVFKLGSWATGIGILCFIAEMFFRIWS